MDITQNHLLKIYKRNFKELLKDIVTFERFCSSLIEWNILTINHKEKFQYEINKIKEIKDNLFEELFRIIACNDTAVILNCLHSLGSEQCLKLTSEISRTWERVIERMKEKFKIDYSTISISPFDDENAIPIDKILTPMTLIRIDKNLTDEEGHIEYLEDVDNFLLSIISSRGNRIIIRGPPGIGKTVHMKRLVNQWINNHLNTNQIDIVLVILLRKVRRGQSLLDAIWEQNFIHIEWLDKETLNYLLKINMKSNIVLFLDGADEFHIIDNEIHSILENRENSFSSFTIVVWSREWKAHRIDVTYDFIFQLCGFDENQLLIYYRKCLNENRGNELVDYLKNNNMDLFKTCSTPLIALLVWLVWKEEENHNIVENHFLIYDQFIKILCFKRNVNRETKEFKLAFQYCCELAFKHLGNDRIVLESNKSIHHLKYVTECLGGLLRVINIKYTTERPSSIEEFQFFHLSIQEYFAAKYIINEMKKRSSGSRLSHVLEMCTGGRHEFSTNIQSLLDVNGNLYRMLNVLKFVKALDFSVYEEIVTRKPDVVKALENVSDGIGSIINNGPNNNTITIKHEILSISIIQLIIERYWFIIQKLCLINIELDWDNFIKMADGKLTKTLIVTI
ncbi:DgyrCDS8241 [Dimorphilus gyrociliatus]|uniref:DgyrCDS8241 n=1 Tax=Dimorphilus gyrociliatus TaxID=2664684 RepID=A0A7I8VVZ3_9ANNE|nr:DgyrCDS8241 [Dimorphilus gyrociliatus]